MQKNIDKKTINKKLKQLKHYEKTVGVDERSKALRKWLTDSKYRKRVLQWQQTLLAIHAQFNTLKPGVYVIKENE